MKQLKLLIHGKTFLLSLLTLAISNTVYAQDNFQLRSKILASNCVVCHGPNGKGSRKIPKLKGLDHQDIMESMRGFKTGAERSTIMDRHAKAYTNEELKLLADYFANQNR